MDEDYPAISVVIPVYNTAKHLTNCLDSVSAQTFKNFEVICVDDCSTDESAGILKAYAAKDARFKVVSRLENGGVGAARNQGLSVAKGTYVFFIDSDDTIEDTTFAQVVTRFEETGADIVLFAFAFDYPSEKRRLPYNAALDTSFFGKESLNLFDCATARSAAFLFVSPSVETKSFRRSFIERIGAAFTSHRIAEDLLFSYSAFVQTNALAAVPSCLYYYNQENDTSVSKERGNIPALLGALETLWEKLRELDVQDKYKDAFINLFICHMDRALSLVEDGETLNEVFALLAPWIDYLKKEANNYNLLPGIDEHRDTICLGDPIEYAVHRLRKCQFDIEQLKLRADYLEDLAKEQHDYIEYLENCRSFRLGKALLWLPKRARTVLTRRE